MKRFWISWFSGNYEDEGCTKPPFKFWVSGSRFRVNYGLTEEQRKVAEQLGEEEYKAYMNKHSRDDQIICTAIDAEDESAALALVGKHFPDYEVRFCEEQDSQLKPGSRFPA
jgi:fructose-1,6-bisphosphatase/inositol monophosphatase family enzyme